ncbi:hypothetical protein [Janibacter sp. GS2]|uniref:hypothetical protein n=1 Tax=Janibacter sp. GS2 TaxID=3442646 RepID=UPI003EBB2C67
MSTHLSRAPLGRRGVLVAAAIAATLTACSAGPGAEGDATMHLRITASDSEDAVRINATEGATATIPSSAVGDVDVEVQSIDGSTVVFATGEAMAPEGKTGGINLNDTRSDFSVTKGTSVQFSTPTTDASTTWTATLEDGPAPS